MITIGVDLSTRAAKTCAAIIEWHDDGRAALVGLNAGQSPDDLVSLLAQADKTGIDCPFGWPELFVQFLKEHQSQASAGDALAPRKMPTPRPLLAYRRTDLFVHKQTGITPLSVSADRIGLTAMHCADILNRYAENHGPVDRSGSDRLVEVYPAASLKQWGLPWRGYKTKDTSPLNSLVDDLLRQFGTEPNGGKPRLWLGDYEEAVRNFDDAFDAVLAACTARAAALRRTMAPDAAPDVQHAARTEGWIHIPTGSLSELCGVP